MTSNKKLLAPAKRGFFISLFLYFNISFIAYRQIFTSPYSPPYKGGGDRKFILYSLLYKL